MLAEAVKSLAYDAGYLAAYQDKTRVPALCPFINALLSIKKKGATATQIMESWLEGYDHRVDENVAALFPEDKFFQDKLKVK